MSYKIIPRSYYSKCKICGKSLKSMKIRGRCEYFQRLFIKHIKDEHNMEIREYFEKYTDLIFPLCQCGCGEKVGIFTGSGKEMRLCNYIRFHSTANDEKFKKFVNRIKKERIGEGNPMYKKDAWNKGLNKHNNGILKTISIKRKGIEFSEDTRKKMSESARRREIHGNSGHIHSLETRRKIREATFNQIKRGVFEQLKSKPHQIMSLILDEMGIKWEEEKQRGFFSFDFQLVEYDNLYFEVDGDYFHSNPRSYPDGPISKTQKRNAYRDHQKNKFCKENEINLYRFWEYDIKKNKEQIKERIKRIICDHKKLPM